MTPEGGGTGRTTGDAVSGALSSGREAPGSCCCDDFLWDGDCAPIAAPAISLIFVATMAEAGVGGRGGGRGRGAGDAPVIQRGLWAVRTGVGSGRWGDGGMGGIRNRPWSGHVGRPRTQKIKILLRE